MEAVYLNRIATAVPDFDVHQKFVDYCPKLFSDKRHAKLFQRMASRAQVEHRYSFLEPDPDLGDEKLDAQGFYSLGGFPTTEQRMALYEKCAPKLAYSALDQLDLSGITHLIVTTCTGFYAPGIDQQIIEHYGLSPNVERTTVGFMGCNAAINALKLARHIVRSDREARVLVLNLELCTLHLKSEGTLEEMLSFLIFADGCAASVVSAEPQGMELQSFKSTCLRDTSDLITWRIGDAGFDMHLSGQVPGAIAAALPHSLDNLLDGSTRSDITHWAIHPGGRSVLDAVREGAHLQEEQLAQSREVLRRYGNMSSATIMFVLQAMLEDSAHPGAGFAMAFGPGLSVETMRFAV